MRESEVVDVAEGKARMTTEAGRSGPGFQWDRQRGKRGSIANRPHYVLFCLLLHVKIAKALVDRMPSLFDASALFTATHWLPTARNPDDAFIFWGGGGGASCVCVLTSYPCTGERIRRKMLEYELQKTECWKSPPRSNLFSCGQQDIVFEQLYHGVSIIISITV